MRAAIIPADETQPVRIEEIKPGLEDLQAIVGGSFQLILAGPMLSLYLNEEGKLKALPVNRRATAMGLAAYSIRSDDFIAGDAVLLGVIDDNGNDRGLDSYEERWVLDFDAAWRGPLGAHA